MRDMGSVGNMPTPYCIELTGEPPSATVPDTEPTTYTNFSY